ncbi:MAG: hypothetical protein N2036_08890 [Bryobacteraceae bacterium]|nr:hypothetical protein [Bryobacteraceae bacterium]
MLSGIPRRTLLASLAAALPLPLRAADPWTKPPGEWTEKDIQRILTDSPWAKQVSITLSSGMPMGGGGGRRGGRGGAPMGGGMADASVGGGSDPGMGGMGGRPGMGEGMGGTMAPSITFQIRWQSAKPIKLATVRARMGAEADSSPQAREFVEREEPDYVIAVIGPPMGPPEGEMRPGGMGGPAPGGEPKPEPGKGGPAGGGRERRGGDPEQWMAALKENTWLAWKEHEKLHPSSVTLPPGGPRGVLIFRFPKDHPIELEDREVEFCMRRGPMEVKKKFRLKDMVYEGKLSL